MTADNYFVTRKPENQFLSTIVDSYFYLDVPVELLSPNPEYIIPYPRITFGYFFNHPFTATNLTLKESVTVEMVISKISTHKIIVQPNTERVKILGAHVKPYCLAYFTKQSIRKLPWLINTHSLFPNAAHHFQKRVDGCSNTEEMFDEVERIFLDTILIRDLSLITSTVELIENNSGNIDISTLPKIFGVTDRTIRNQFYDCVGCSPKEFIRLVKLRHVAYQMKHSQKSLTDIAHDNQYFDQSHFIHEVKNITGRTPNQLRKKIPDFRFLQF